MPGPTPYDILLTLGAVILGASLWRAFNTSFRSYATQIVDCDKPFSLSDVPDDDLEFLNSLTGSARQKVLSDLRNTFEDQCRIEGKRRMGIDEKVYERHVYRGFDPRNVRPMYPGTHILHAVPPVVSTFARAYATEDEDIYDCDDKGCRRRKRVPGFSEMGNPGGSNPSFSAPERPPPPNELGSFNRDEGQYKYLKPEDQAELAAKRRAAYLKQKRAGKRQAAPKTMTPLEHLSGYISNRLDDIFNGKPFPSPIIPLQSPIGVGQPIEVAPLAYASTRLDTEALGGDLYTLGQCKQAGGNSKCCKAGMYQNRVDADTVANCKLCNHPNCDDYTTVRNDPTITAPFQLGKFNIEGPPALSDPKSNFALAYDTDQGYVDNPILRESDIIDCDKPFELSHKQLAIYKNLSPSRRAEYVNNAKYRFRDMCLKEAARRAGANTQFLPIDPSARRPGSGMFPERGRDASGARRGGRGFEFPNAHPSDYPHLDTRKTPTLLFGDEVPAISEFAYAY